MASLPDTKAKVAAKDKKGSERQGPVPLIAEHNKYVYRPAPMNACTQDIVKSARAKKVKIDLPVTTYATIKLVHALCESANHNVWGPECDKALAEMLPVREHHKAFLSHNMFVTMIGGLVARALEQATRDCADTLDLLADRYFIRSIACHDSSKTSTVEASAYAGIMAVHMEKEALERNAKKRRQLHARYKTSQGNEDINKSSLDKIYSDTESLTSAMANFGFKHHYEMNPHHPEHFTGSDMDDMSVIEAIVDGLACIFERNKNHTHVRSWLEMYHLARFREPNQALARNIMEALKLYITEADYKALVTFRRSIFAIVGESIPWSSVLMTECCAHTVEDPDRPQRTFAPCFETRK